MLRTISKTVRGMYGVSPEEEKVSYGGKDLHKSKERVMG